MILKNAIYSRRKDHNNIFLLQYLQLVREPAERMQLNNQQRLMRVEHDSRVEKFFCEFGILFF